MLLKRKLPLSSPWNTLFTSQDVVKHQLKSSVMLTAKYSFWGNKKTLLTAVYIKTTVHCHSLHHTSCRPTVSNETKPTSSHSKLAGRLTQAGWSCLEASIVRWKILTDWYRFSYPASLSFSTRKQRRSRSSITAPSIFTPEVWE